MEEIWKDIPGYEGMYQASTSGRIKSFFTHRYSELNIEGKILSVQMYYGYITVKLSINNTQKRYKVHRLIAMTFIPNPACKAQVNHKNGIKTDNTVSNLEWCTREENMKHARDTGLREMMYGQNNTNAKLKEADVIDIRSKYSLGNCTYKNLSDEYRVSTHAIRAIITGKKWKRVSDKDDYQFKKYGAKGENCYFSKLTPEKVLKIREMKDTHTQKEIANIFSVNRSNISSILLGKTWKHI